MTVPLSEATQAPRHYAIWFDSGRGYAQLGGVLAVDERASIVTRAVVNAHTTETGARAGAQPATANTAEPAVPTHRWSRRAL